MAEHKPLYIWSQQEAIRNNEQDMWRESYRENCACARAIEKAIQVNYSDNRLADCAQGVIEQYGFDRVKFVLANTVREKENDGRFSAESRRWAECISIPLDGVRWHYVVDSHPGLTDIFINQVRKAWQELGLFDKLHCESEDGGELDYTNRVLVLDPSVLKDQYKTPEDQLFLARSGFGCSPNSRGCKVFGEFLKDGDETFYARTDFLGILRDEFLPAWAREKLGEIQHTEGSSSVNEVIDYPPLYQGSYVMAIEKGETRQWLKP